MQDSVLKKEWFADVLSMRAFEHAVLMAKKMQDKMLSLKSGSLIMYDGELLISPNFKSYFCGDQSSVFIELKDDHSKVSCSYSLCGCTSDANTGQIYARKKDVDETFKRISFFQKV
jgi:hypothetical protein